MKKFESVTHKQCAENTNTTSKLSKIIEILPSIVQVLPKLLGKNQPTTTESTTTEQIYYPTTPTVSQFKATQIRNTIDSIQAHKYLVSTIKNNNVIIGNSPLFQQTDTLPNNPRHQH